MKTIFGLANIKERLRGGVLVIGVFDGLHRGHRYLIKSAVSTAKRIGKISACLTFHPHPQGLPYLISLKHRLKLVEDLGVDYCVVILFNKRFAKIKPRDFIENIVVKIFSPRFIFIGGKFHFGYKAQGDVKLLKSYEKKFGFKVRAIRELKIAKRIISSNVIRSLIKDGNLAEAEEFLGRRVSVLGTVRTGFRRGRLLGYPTANINPHHEVLPRPGVYAVKIIYPIGNYSLIEKHKELYSRNYYSGDFKVKKKIKVYQGMCYIGRRPTFGINSAAMAIEVHIFNFEKDIYGEDVEIQFVRMLRPEKKFPSKYHLVFQLDKDRQKALQILNLA